MKTFSRSRKGRDAQRAVDSCLRAAADGRLTPAHIQMVLECEGVDLSAFSRFLEEGTSDMVRCLVADIVAKYEPGLVVETAAREAGNPRLFNAMCKALAMVGFKEVEPLVPILRGEDVVAPNRVLRLFVEVGRADLLFPLVFDGDERMVERVKRYLHGQGLI